MRFLKSWVLVGLCIGLASCEKAIDFNLAEAPPKLVVEATIETGESPVVVLTNSFAYFSAISPDLLANAFVHDAIVTISNGQQTHTLVEKQIGITDAYSFYYYGVDSSNLETAFTGEFNKNYTLSIRAGGQEYNAATTIPAQTKVVDSVWWKPAPPSTDSSRVVVIARATDPPGFGNYGRYFTKKNNEPFFPGLTSVFDDLFVDGTTYDITIEPGFDRNAEREDDDLFFHRGDSLQLKLSGIDRNTYEFWRTMEYSYVSIGNPFATPIKVLGNISNGALGYFGGYASQIYTLYIPE